MKPVKVGVIGCGNISAIYLTRMKIFPNLDVCACADLVLDRARARAEEFKIPRACSVDELLNDKEVEIVVNLTIPAVHASVGMEILKSGKNLYNEKPLTVSREDGRKLLDEARKRGLLVGCAPDTVLGAGIQTCRKLIDEGAIGRPIGATGFMMCHGHESWHPDPEFYYKVGGGPLFDMGPYYISALITLLGPARRVTGSASISFPERTITSQQKVGQKIKVDTPTHIASILDFKNGAVATIVMSFDVWSHTHSNLEIYGTEGSMQVPDPNGFGGTVRLKKSGDKEWNDIPLTHGYSANTRGLGVADMAQAVRNGGSYKANGAVAFHVLDIFHGTLEASQKNSHVILSSDCSQPEPMKPGLAEGEL